jgi:hypothetical protein
MSHWFLGKSSYLLEERLTGIYLFIFFVVLGFELRAYTLSHSTSTFL